MSSWLWSPLHPRREEAGDEPKDSRHDVFQGCYSRVASNGLPLSDEPSERSERPERSEGRRVPCSGELGGGQIVRDGFSSCCQGGGIRFSSDTVQPQLGLFSAKRWSASWAGTLTRQA